MLRTTKQFDDFQSLAPEILNEILSHLTLKELSTLSRTCQWLHDRLAHLRLAVRIKQELFFPQCMYRESSFTYSHVRRKLNQQAFRQRKELAELYEALWSMMVLAFIVLGPMVAGYISELAGLNNCRHVLGVSSTSIGVLLGAGMAIGVTGYYLRQNKSSMFVPPPLPRKILRKNSEEILKENASISAIQKL